MVARLAMEPAPNLFSPILKTKEEAGKDKHDLEGQMRSLSEEKLVWREPCPDG
jgi:hypothetical protein